ncbi:hypothetical protein PQ469_22155 [Mucilaginibacter sp. KACC 22773]|uniref:hypothetical protein n=1 Tax=Mucilaginibacter sp. KACC 22773 TaxID=3025671 RepID=UPI0023663F7D|nr:hypothetical protein [Mucilaginibacter sp. KACC 22773]WDF76593.1 hypothetical protein PQ469_22155 [Mucilaginibacter sp. KACC 22773]
MGSKTYIISKEIADTPTDINFEIMEGVYCFRFYADYWEMQNFLSICKVITDINEVYLSCSVPLIELVHQLQIKNYLIEFENDFAGIPDESGFIIPVSNGIILHEFIVDEDNDDFAALKRAYNAVGLEYP